jgi:hypothetical protein
MTCLYWQNERCGLGRYGGKPSIGTCQVCADRPGNPVERYAPPRPACAGCGGESLVNLKQDPRAIERALAEGA